jgi:hypothetical protein
VDFDIKEDGLKGFAFLNGAMGGEDYSDDESLLLDFVIN